jgi:hypothetical protein
LLRSTTAASYIHRHHQQKATASWPSLGRKAPPQRTGQDARAHCLRATSHQGSQLRRHQHGQA